MQRLQDNASKKTRTTAQLQHRCSSLSTALPYTTGTPRHTLSKPYRCGTYGVPPQREDRSMIRTVIEKHLCMLYVDIYMTHCAANQRGQSLYAQQNDRSCTTGCEPQTKHKQLLCGKPRTLIAASACSCRGALERCKRMLQAAGDGDNACLQQSLCISGGHRVCLLQQRSKRKNSTVAGRTHQNAVLRWGGQLICTA